jgi:2-polyprenyl-6-methoxyphenol hydroxylase-like FAD-dependent oxidoreductase
VPCSFDSRLNVRQDERDIDESWSFPGKKEDVLKTLESYDPVVHEIVKATPEDRLVDWKLVYRDPLPTWISPKARLALAGDAAHPFLPTSIQGASQAVEDGVTIAICLQLASKAKSPLALRAYEKIRYQRVKEVQKTGETTRDGWHKADFEVAVRKNPEMIKLPRAEWLLNFDAEAHAYSVFGNVVASM